LIESSAAIAACRTFGSVAFVYGRSASARRPRFAVSLRDVAQERRLRGRVAILLQRFNVHRAPSG
jgi:hypothetical protein